MTSSGLQTTVVYPNTSNIYSEITTNISSKINLFIIIIQIIIIISLHF